MSIPPNLVRAVRLVPVLAVAVLIGCGQDGPKNYAVSGRVELNGGDVARLAGSMIEVASTTDPTVRAFGVIQPDGRFELQSLQNGELRNGLPEGSYTARVIPNDEDGESRKRASKAVSPRYLQFDRSGLTIDVPAESDLTLRLSAK